MHDEIMTPEEFDAMYVDLPDNLKDEFAEGCTYPSWDAMVDLLCDHFDDGDKGIFLRVHGDVALWWSLHEEVIDAELC